MNKIIPLIKLPHNEEDAQAVADVVRSGFWGLGNVMYEFERELAKFTGSKYAICVDSCTSALFLSMKYIEPRKVSIPTMTVSLVANAILEAGGDVVFNDDVEWVGNSYHLKNSNVYDSAHELHRDCFLKYPEGSSVCVSFYPTKPLGSADGGAVLTNDPDMAEWLRVISTYGRDQKAKYANSWDYEITKRGYKRHYTNLQSALCLSQLKRLDETNRQRGLVRDKYNKAFGLNSRSNYLYRMNIRDRDNFIKYMADNNVTCGMHYKPMHLMKAYKDFPIEGDVEKVMKNYRETVSIPFYAGMTEEETDKVISLVRKWNDLAR